MASGTPSSRNPLINGGNVCVPSTMNRTVPRRNPVTERNRKANSAARRNTSDLTPLVGRKKAIPKTPHRLNGVDFKATIEFCPQSADMTFHDTGMGIEMDSPHVLEEHLACDDSVDVSQHVFQQARLLRRKIDLPPFSDHSALYQI